MTATRYRLKSPPTTPEECLELNWNVVPCGTDKLPLVKWKYYQEKHRVKLEHVDYWRKTLKTRIDGWAIVCGPISDVLALDFDGPQGRMTCGRLLIVPHQTTPGDGFHVYYHHPKEAFTIQHARLRECYPGCEVKTAGSLCHVLGKGYQWTTPASMSYAEQPLAPSITKHLELPKPTEPAAPLVREEKRAQADWLVTMARGQATIRGRNHGGFWLACMVRDNGYAGAEAESIMRAYQESVTTGTHPYTWDEAAASLKSANRQLPRNPTVRGYHRQQGGASIV